MSFLFLLIIAAIFGIVVYACATTYQRQEWSRKHEADAQAKQARRAQRQLFNQQRYDSTMYSAMSAQQYRTMHHPH